MGLLLGVLLVTGIAIVATATGIGAGSALARVVSGDSPRLGELAGVRLGMTAADVRARFDPGGRSPGAGRWQVAPSGLEWTADTEGVEAARRALPSVNHAKFEFHAGMLVAVRADLAAGDEAAGGPLVESSRAVVRARRPTRSGVALTILARDCPTHADEARALLNP